MDKGVQEGQQCPTKRQKCPLVSQPCREVLGLPQQGGSFAFPAAGGGGEERILRAAQGFSCFRGAL